MGLSSKVARVSDRKLTEVELDLGRYELRRNGRRIKLEKKPMELLTLFAGRREQLVLRQDITAHLWGSDLFVDTERNINNIVRKIRTALGDNVVKPCFLETVVGKGYRLIGPIRVVSPLYSPSSTRQILGDAQSVPQDASWYAQNSSLAVLPLRSVGQSSEAKQTNDLSLAITDALVSRLGNLSGIDVLPISAVLNTSPDAAALESASRLGVRFVVHGAIQTSKTEPRLSVELYDSHSQSSCFSRKFSLDLNAPFGHVSEIASEIAKDTARAVRRPLHEPMQSHARYSHDPFAYAEFLQGYRRSFSGDPTLLHEATHHLTNAVARDPAFALAHAVLSFVCAVRHFEFDPSRNWLEKAEFHCSRALKLDPELAEGHVARAFLLWGPSKNFQHFEAIAELKRSLFLQKNLPHAYNRLGTIFAHIGLLDHAGTMYRRGAPFDPRKKISHSIAQVYLWNGEYDLARDEIESWRVENPANKYAVYFAAQPALLTGDWEHAKGLLHEAVKLMPEEPLIISLQGVLHALSGKSEQALRCMSRACATPKTFGHAHHTYYQIACILSLLNRAEAGFEWLERSIDTGFACWPFFLKDPCLKNLREHSQFELLVGSLQAKYPADMGLL